MAGLRRYGAPPPDSVGRTQTHLSPSGTDILTRAPVALHARRRACARAVCPTIGSRTCSLINFVVPCVFLVYNDCTMKKIVLIFTLIAVIGAVAGVLVACSNATTEQQLENVWQSYEKYTYKVDYKDAQGADATGTYVNEIVAYKSGSAVQVGSIQLPSAGAGYLVSGKLTTGDTVIDTACYFELSKGNVYLVPVATYRKETTGGNVTFELSGSYDGSNLNYTGKKADGSELKGSVSLSSPYYDNAQFHQTLRGVGSQMGSSFSFSFRLALVTAQEQSAITLTATVTETTTVATGIASGDSVLSLDCYKTKISRSTTISGESQYLYYANTPVKCVVDGEGNTSVVTDDGAGWNLTNVLVKMEEPYKAADGSVAWVTYTLTDISLQA